MERVDEQSSAVSPVPQPTTPRCIDRWAAFAWFHVPRCFCNANPLFSLSLRTAGVRVALEGRLLPRSSRPIRQACGAVSYGMVCHSCGFWLVTKPEPDSFLGLFSVFETHRFGTILRHYIVIRYVRIFLAVGKWRGSQQELRKKTQTVRKQPRYLHYLHSCLCVL